MIKLTELVHIIQNGIENGLVPTDKWKITDADYLTDMGFKQDGMYTFYLKRPELKVIYKKGEGFKLEDKKKKATNVFPTFKDLVQYFENYQQEFENQPYL